MAGTGGHGKATAEGPGVTGRMRRGRRGWDERRYQAGTGVAWTGRHGRRGAEGRRGEHGRGGSGAARQAWRIEAGLG